MFFVTILLNEVLAWMRTQPGTSSLRAVLYMDEIFGYFPPTANPPSKMPMLTLLKQARAFGLGVVLATQNPVDLDYKGLSNAGTWFLGRLQTERDKDRVLEGLEGASTAAGHSFDRQKMDEILSGLGNRVFLMNNVHDDQPVVFQTRWALSYLRGPLTREQIQTLMAPRKAAQPALTPSPACLHHPVLRSDPGSASTPTGTSGTALSEVIGGSRPVVPPDVPEFFIPRRGRSTPGRVLYRPALLGVARLHYTDKKSGVDHWETLGSASCRRGDAGGGLEWRRSTHRPRSRAGQDARARGKLRPLAGPLTRAKSYAEWTKGLKNYLYREHKLTVWSCPDLKAYSRPEESERDFRVRLSQGSRELATGRSRSFASKYAPKRNKLQEKVRKAREKLDREQAQASKAKWDAAVSFGNSVLGRSSARRR